MGFLKKEIIFEDITKLKGVGSVLSKYLKKKRIEKIKDIIFNLPYAETDRSKLSKLNELEIGKIQSIKVLVKKLNFPRIRNLPNKVFCEDETGEIEIAPLAFMRGRTLKNCFAILDEAQNATETQIKMFLTRIGENSKLVVNGDPSQVDLINKAYSGLIKSRNILKNIKEIKIIEFDHNDVVRHPLVSKIISAYQNKSTDDKD